MKKVYSTPDFEKSQLLRVELERQDIEVHLHNVHTNAANIPHEDEIHILVPDPDAQQAMEVIPDLVEAGEPSRSAREEQEQWFQWTLLLLCVAVLVALITFYLSAYA